LSTNLTRKLTLIEIPAQHPIAGIAAFWL